MLEFLPVSIHSKSYSYLSPSLAPNTNTNTNTNTTNANAKQPKTIHLAMFDLDSTLIRTKSGAKFPQAASDWQWAFPTVPDVLKQLSETHLIIIVTNQLGLTKGKISLTELTDKFNQIASEFDTSANTTLISAIFIAGEDDHFRKPRTGFWDYLSMRAPYLLTALDRNNSFYCGDAAGRSKGWNPVDPKCSKDFSCSDYYFAHNINIPFKYPEQIFLEPGHPANQKLNTLPLPIYPIPHWKPFFTTDKKVSYPIPLATTEHRELIVLVGAPGSGKSTLARYYQEVHGYLRINQDELKTKAKCLKAAKEAINKGQSLVIDNTNPALELRAEYLTMIHNTNTTNTPKYTTTAIEMVTPEEVCQHLNQYRVQSTQGQIKKIPIIAYRIYYKKLIPPTTVEGFDRVVRQPFQIDPAQLSSVQLQEFNYYYDF